MNTGLVEVPMGITLREIVFEIGGGIPDGRQFKAVQTGGPSGGCIPAEYLDMPVDYESLAKARLDHGLGRHDRDGRDVLHGRRGPVLHGILHDRVVRQVHPLPRRHRPDARAAGQASPRRTATAQDVDAARGALRPGAQHQPLRPGPDRAQPGAEHAALLPRRVQGARRTEDLSRRSLRARSAKEAS